MPKAKVIPKRSQVKPEDTWDLTQVFKSDKAWEKAFKQLEQQIPEFQKFRGKLGKSAKTLRALCDLEADVDKVAEKVGVYAYLKSTEDLAESRYQAMMARVAWLGTRMAEATSWISPEIQAIPKKQMDAYLKDPALEPYRFNLQKLLRFKPHILTEKEERVLAMQGEVAEANGHVFEQLNDADLKFGFVEDETGQKVELSQSSFRSLLESPKRSVRKEAFHKFYAQYEGHANTFAATLKASVLQDVYQARVRNFPSAREAALFGDKVPVEVYDRLIDTVRANLPAQHRYFEIRKRALKLKDMRAYDLYAPIVKLDKVNIPYETAAETICEALTPLGDEYVKTLRRGFFEGRWVDRYENQGKRSGAFSYGAHDCPPYMMMNYRDDVLDSMFTLAHEAGHSMHSYYSSRHQPYQYSHYTIFVAEVASTFNEQLLNHLMLSKASTKKERARLLNREIDEIRGTIVRQTMFAEYEKVLHAHAEAGEPLTLDLIRSEYRALLDAYFGPGFVIDKQLSLEGLRIPHFYNAFYVYKYATGLSAAIALSRMVLEGGARERDRYLRFLQSGGSKYPLDLLRDAGVDLAKPQPVNMAMEHFAHLVDELEAAL